MLTATLQPVERRDTLKKEQFLRFLGRLWGGLALAMERLIYVTTAQRDRKMEIKLIQVHHKRSAFLDLPQEDGEV